MIYHKNTAYTEQTEITTSESIQKIASGKHTFDDIENVYTKLFKRFIMEPTITNNEEWRKFQLKYVPFKKQELSPEFISNITKMLDILIEKRKYDIFNIAQTRVMSLLTTVIDYKTQAKILEKNIAFFSSDPSGRYNEEVQENKKMLKSVNISINLDKKSEHRQVNRDQATPADIKLSQTLDDISDTLLDLGSLFKNNFLQRLDREGVRDIITDTN